MANALTQDCRALWLSMARDASWWSVTRLTQHWRPTFSLAEVEEHLATLHKGQFVERSPCGTTCAVTARCLPLPGHPFPPQQPHETAPMNQHGHTPIQNNRPPQAMGLLPPPQHNVLGGTYMPHWPVPRAGAMDYAALPSLHMGRRRAFRSDAV